MKISARNRLKGKVVSVEKDGLMAKIKIEISTPASVTAVITKDAAEDLNLKVRSSRSSHKVDRSDDRQVVYSTTYL